MPNAQNRQSPIGKKVIFTGSRSECKQSQSVRRKQMRRRNLSRWETEATHPFGGEVDWGFPLNPPGLMKCFAGRAQFPRKHVIRRHCMWVSKNIPGEMAFGPKPTGPSLLFECIYWDSNQAGYRETENHRGIRIT